jgi:acetate kinase
MLVLAINAGSSSLKCALHELAGTGAEAGAPPPPRWAKGQPVEDPVEDLLASLWKGDAAILAGPQQIDVVGHLFVHDGPSLVESVRITPAVRKGIEQAGELPPEHNAHALRVLHDVTRLLGASVSQVAVFDTALHGISHRYAAHRAALLLKRDVAALRVVVCHIGAGCSLAAVRGGISVDATMCVPPLDVAPGGDMRAVLAAADAGDTGMQPAFDVYVRRIQQAAASMAVSMNGLDALVFTGGVGEHAPRVRAAICKGLGLIGVELNAAANERADGDANCSVTWTSVAVLVVRAEENWVVAQECARVLASSYTGESPVAPSQPRTRES